MRNKCNEKIRMMEYMVATADYNLPNVVINNSFQKVEQRIINDGDKKLKELFDNDDPNLPIAENNFILYYKRCMSRLLFSKEYKQYIGKVKKTCPIFLAEDSILETLNANAGKGIPFRSSNHRNIHPCLINNNSISVANIVSVGREIIRIGISVPIIVVCIFCIRSITIIMFSTNSTDEPVVQFIDTITLNASGSAKRAFLRSYHRYRF